MAVHRLKALKDIMTKLGTETASGAPLDDLLGRSGSVPQTIGCWPGRGRGHWLVLIKKSNEMSLTWKGLGELGPMLKRGDLSSVEAAGVHQQVTAKA